MSAAADWSLTPQTVARVAGLETPPGPIDVPPAAESALESDPTRRLGVDCCARCAAPDPATSCERCARVRYCSARCASDDAATHAPACPHLAFAASLDAESGSPSRSADDAKSAAAAVREVIANLKLLGADAAAKLLGPRGYRREEEEDGEPAAASADAVKPRWRAVFKLSSAALAEDEKNAGAAIAARRLVAHAERLSDPLSVVAASWMFPVVKYALMLGVGGEGRAEEDETAAADKELTPAVVHVVRGSGGDWCEATADAMWLVGYGAALEKPGVEVTVVAPDLPEGWHRARRSVGGDERGTRSVSFHRGRYDDFAGDATGGTKEGGDASPASTGPCLVFALDLCEALDECEVSEEEEGNEGGGGGWMRSVRAAGCPVLTANRNQFELAAERERMEDELGYVLVGMARNPFPCPVPRQSPASANEVHRRNEWLAAYVPASLTHPVSDELEQRGVAPGKRSAGDDESGDRGDGGGEKRARR